MTRKIWRQKRSITYEFYTFILKYLNLYTSFGKVKKESKMKCHLLYLNTLSDNFEQLRGHTHPNRQVFTVTKLER